MRQAKTKPLSQILLANMLLVATLSCLLVGCLWVIHETSRFNADIVTMRDSMISARKLLLATCALIVGTTMLIRLDKLKYAWTTAIPGLLVMPICMWVGYLNITDNFLPKGLYLLATLSIILMLLMTVVFIEAFRRWYALIQTDSTVTDGYGDHVLALATDREETLRGLNTDT
jgi:carbon starvation protein CstA